MKDGTKEKIAKVTTVVLGLGLLSGVIPLSNYIASRARQQNENVASVKVEDDNLTNAQNADVAYSDDTQEPVSEPDVIFLDENPQGYDAGNNGGEQPEAEIQSDGVVEKNDENNEVDKKTPEEIPAEENNEKEETVKTAEVSEIPEAEEVEKVAEAEKAIEEIEDTENIAEVAEQAVEENKNETENVAEEQEEVVEEKIEDSDTATIKVEHGYKVMSSVVDTPRQQSFIHKEETLDASTSAVDNTVTETEDVTDTETKEASIAEHQKIEEIEDEKTDTASVEPAENVEASEIIEEEVIQEEAVDDNQTDESKTEKPDVEKTDEELLKEAQDRAMALEAGLEEQQAEEFMNSMTEEGRSSTPEETAEEKAEPADNSELAQRLEALQTGENTTPEEVPEVIEEENEPTENTAEEDISETEEIPPINNEETVEADAQEDVTAEEQEATTKTMLYVGGEGEPVRTLQEMLLATGYIADGGEATGLYDDTTKTAIANWQMERGIVEEGVGIQTFNSLGLDEESLKGTMTYPMGTITDFDSEEHPERYNHGDTGRLYIPSLDIEVALYQGGIGEEWHTYAYWRNSMPDSATFYQPEGHTIVDYLDQSFARLPEVTVGSTAYIETEDGTQTNYMCTETGYGTDTHADVLDWDGVSYASWDYDIATIGRESDENDKIFIAKWKQIKDLAETTATEDLVFEPSTPINIENKETEEPEGTETPEEINTDSIEVTIKNETEDVEAEETVAEQTDTEEVVAMQDYLMTVCKMARGDYKSGASRYNTLVSMGYTEADIDEMQGLVDSIYREDKMYCLYLLYVDSNTNEILGYEFVKSDTAPSDADTIKDTAIGKTTTAEWYTLDENGQKVTIDPKQPMYNSQTWYLKYNEDEKETVQVATSQEEETDTRAEEITEQTPVVEETTEATEEETTVKEPSLVVSFNANAETETEAETEVKEKAEEETPIEDNDVANAITIEETTEQETESTTKEVVEEETTDLSTVYWYVGGKGAGIQELQTALIQNGYLASGATSTYDKNTEEAVAKFQMDNGIEEPGVGVKTLTALGLPETLLEKDILYPTGVARKTTAEADRKALNHGDMGRLYFTPLGIDVALYQGQVGEEHHDYAYWRANLPDSAVFYYPMGMNIVDKMSQEFAGIEKVKEGDRIYIETEDGTQYSYVCIGSGYGKDVHVNILDWDDVPFTEWDYDIAITGTKDDETDVLFITKWKAEAENPFVVEETNKTEEPVKE